MADSNTNERRSQARIPFINLITYSLSETLTIESRKKTDQAAAINISDGGLCLLVNEPVHEGDLLRVDLPLADVVTTSPTLAEVKWSEPLPWSSQASSHYFVGVQFLL